MFLKIAFNNPFGMTVPIINLGKKTDKQLALDMKGVEIQAEE